MQILIMYYSRSGHTKALAEAVADGIAGFSDIRCLCKAIDDVTEDDFVTSDAIIAGSPVYFGSMAAELKGVFDRFVGLRKKMENKIGAAFATAGDLSGGKETTLMSIIQAFLIYGMVIVGDPLSATGHYGVACTGTPDAATRDNAAQLGRRVALLVKKLQN